MVRSVAVVSLLMGLGGALGVSSAQDCAPDQVVGEWETETVYLQEATRQTSLSALLFVKPGSDELEVCVTVVEEGRNPSEGCFYFSECPLDDTVWTPLKVEAKVKKSGWWLWSKTRVYIRLEAGGCSLIREDSMYSSSHITSLKIVASGSSSWRLNSPSDTCKTPPESDGIATPTSPSYSSTPTSPSYSSTPTAFLSTSVVTVLVVVVVMVVVVGMIYQKLRRTSTISSDAEGSLGEAAAPELQVPPTQVTQRSPVPDSQNPSTPAPQRPSTPALQRPPVPSPRQPRSENPVRDMRSYQGETMSTRERAFSENLCLTTMKPHKANTCPASNEEAASNTLLNEPLYDTIDEPPNTNTFPVSNYRGNAPGSSVTVLREPMYFTLDEQRPFADPLPVVKEQGGTQRTSTARESLYVAMDGLSYTNTNPVTEEQRQAPGNRANVLSEPHYLPLH